MYTCVTDPKAKEPRGYALRTFYLDVKKVAPVGPVREERGKKYYFAAFRLNPPTGQLVEENVPPVPMPGLLESAAARASRGAEREWEVPTPRFIGEFEAFNYYWQIECPWYGKEEGGNKGGIAMGCYLRLRHGTDYAGVKHRGNVVGLEVEYRFRLHCSENLRKCYKISEPFREDMLNVKGQKRMYGYKRFLNDKECKKMLKEKPDLHVSIEIRRVHEMATEVYW